MSELDWKNIKRLNFTYAMEGGAWIEDLSGYRDWVPFRRIILEKGEDWLSAARRKQGWMTGCWIDVD